MRAIVLEGKQQRPIELDSSTLLGKGGEKTVHRDPANPHTRAIAIYHDPTASRGRKVKAFLDIQSKGAWPSEILAPDVAVTNDRGNALGFGMRQLPRNYAKWKDLFTPSFCDNNGITTKKIAGLGLTVLRNLTAINRKSITVGDLNDGGILFDPADLSVAWVDVDSWDIPGYPCVVGTELYLVPTLYNIDLSHGQHFEPWMDHYAFSVLFMRAILRKHPFKAGDHPQFGGVLQRAAAGMTVLDSGVDTSGLKNFHPGLLSDDLANALLKHLKLQERGELPINVLEQYHDELTECGSCKVWYPATRRQCPVCSEVTTVDLKSLLGVDVVELIETKGRVLHVQLAGQVILCVAEERGELAFYRKELVGAAVRRPLGLNYERGMSFGFMDKTLVIASEGSATDDTGELYLLDITADIELAARTSSEILAGRSTVFATSARFLYRLAGGMLVREKRFGPKDMLSVPVTQVFRNQCWFTADSNPISDRETIFGVNRDVRAEHWFVSVGTKGGEYFETHSVPIEPLARGESLQELKVHFDESTILVVRQTTVRGKLQVRLDTVDANTGAVTNHEVIDPALQNQWDSVHGKAFKRGMIMHPTDSGITTERLSDHRTRSIAGTAPIVSVDDLLMPYGAGILVARHSKLSLVNPR